MSKKFTDQKIIFNSSVYEFCFSISLFILQLIFLGCNDRVAGTGVETTSGVVVGRVLYSDQTPATAQPIKLRAVYLTPEGDSVSAFYSTITDAKGWYRFKNIPPGIYAIQSAHGGAGNVEVSIGLQPRLVNPMQGGLVVEDLLLKNSITLIGRVLPPLGFAPESILVCIPGLGACSKPRKDSIYTLSQVPSGTYDILFLSERVANYLPIQVTSTGGGPFYVKDIPISSKVDSTTSHFTLYASRLMESFSVIPKEYSIATMPIWYSDKNFNSIKYFRPVQNDYVEISSEDLSQWPFKREFSLSSSSLINGPDSLSNPLPALINFPFLLRLTASNFDFSQAADGGKDLRFVQNGHSLPYQIEHWDSAAAQAEIWVRVDTLAAKSSNASLQMLWGNESAVIGSNGPEVFTKNLGYLGIWHLADSNLDATIADAAGSFSGKFISGNVPSNTRDRSFSSIIGNGLKFNGMDENIVLPNHPFLDQTETFTVSIWAKNNLDYFSKNQALVSKWESEKMEWIFSITGTGYLELHFGYGKYWQSKWVSVSQLSNLKGWNAFAATYDKGIIHFYVNGQEIAAQLWDKGNAVPKTIYTLGATIRIGGMDPNVGFSWEGLLDEFRFSDRVRSSEWIRAEYLNQKIK